MIKKLTGLLLVALPLAACGTEEHAQTPERRDIAGSVHEVQSRPVQAVIDAAGVASPIARATISTKLMGAVTEVLVREGDAVRSGQLLVRIDARELAAKGAQVAASMAEAKAVREEAATHAARMRALFADDAAPKAQLDAAETGLARAEAAVGAAEAGAAELDALLAYAQVRAPFSGTVTRRMVDPGAFAAPGVPLLTIEDGSRLRVSASASPDAVRGLARGDTVAVTIEAVPTTGLVEGVVPSPGANLYTVNAVVDNADGRFLSGSAATIALPQGTRPAILVPAAAVRHEGDLTGVYVRTGHGTELRWVKPGRLIGDSVEVLSGIRDGDQVVIPATTEAS